MCHTTLSNSPDKKRAIRAIKPAVFWVLYLWIVLQLCFSLSTEDVSLALFSFSASPRHPTPLSGSIKWLGEKEFIWKNREDIDLGIELLHLKRGETKRVHWLWVAEKMEGNRGQRQHADRWWRREKKRQGEKVAMIRGGEQQVEGVPFLSYRRVRVTVALEYNCTHEHILYPRIVRWKR